MATKSGLAERGLFGMARSTAMVAARFGGRETVRMVVQRALAVVMIAALPGLSVALPPAHGGKTYCQCRCAGGGDGKDISWEQTASCTLSNGKDCRFTTDGKTFKPGKLGNCETCKPGSTATEYLCGVSAIGSTNTLPQLTPATPKGATISPGATAPGTAQKR